MARKSKIPISERKTLSISLLNSYNHKMKEVLHDWEDEGYDYSNKACEYISNYHELMQNPYIAEQINKYLRFCKSYNNGNVQDDNRKFLMFEDFLNTNKSEVKKEQVPIFNPKPQVPLYQNTLQPSLIFDKDEQSNVPVNTAVDLLSEDISTNEETEEDFFDSFMNE